MRPNIHQNGPEILGLKSVDLNGGKCCRKIFKVYAIFLS
jgi:hypothetical protein